MQQLQGEKKKQMCQYPPSYWSILSLHDKDHTSQVRTRLSPNKLHNQINFSLNTVSYILKNRTFFVYFTMFTLILLIASVYNPICFFFALASVTTDHMYQSC